MEPGLKELKVKYFRRRPSLPYVNNINTEVKLNKTKIYIYNRNSNRYTITKIEYTRLNVRYTRNGLKYTRPKIEYTRPRSIIPSLEKI